MLLLAILLLLAIVAITILSAIWPENQRLQFWLQTLTGNWSPDKISAVKPATASYFLEYGASVFIAIVINLSPIGVAIFLIKSKIVEPFWSVINEIRRKVTMAEAVEKMILQDGLDAWRITTRASLLQAFTKSTDDEEKILEADRKIEESLDAGWKKMIFVMEAAHGKAATKGWFESLKRPVDPAPTPV